MLKSKWTRFIFIEVILKTLILFIACTFLIYFVLWLIPGKSGDRYNETNYSIYTFADDENNELSKSKVWQVFPDYMNWLLSAITGNAKYSEYYEGQSVINSLITRTPITFGITFTSLILAISIALFSSILFSITNSKISHKHNALKKFSYLFNIFIYLLSAVPSFLIGYLFIVLTSTDKGFIFPVLALALGNGLISGMSRTMNNEISREFKNKYIITAVAKGLNRHSILPIRNSVSLHAFRNAIIYILPSLGARLPFTISGAIVIEMVFDIPGLGKLLIDALTKQDVNTVMAMITLSVIVVRIGSILIDIIYIKVNPKYA